MANLAFYGSALLVCLKPINLILIFAMVALGIVFGAIPGLSATLGIALLLPITFGLSTETSFVLLLAIWIGGVSGSFISAVLIGIPGSSSAIATCFDGYPMTLKGESNRALAIGITASFLGTFFSVIIATLLSPIIADFALTLGPWEYFSLCFCAITLVASLSKGNIWKGLMAAGLGLMLGCIGMDPINGTQRFTFGSVGLMGGISTVAQMLGMFAMCQIIRDSAKGEAKMPDANTVGQKGFGISIMDYFRNIKVILFSFVAGLWIGFLPGMGSGISNMVAYGYAKGSNKNANPPFGEGNPAGVWASETANNASLGGALIPMMALGIPGDGITAMLISALTIHGLQAGPLFMTSQPDLAMLIFACVLVSAIVTFIIQMVTKRYFAYILRIPYHFLYSVILIIAYIGGYGISNTMFNIYVMLSLCLLSLFMSIAGLPTSPLVLAFILSGKLEGYFRRAISMDHGSYAKFFTRPLSLALLLLAIFCVVWPYLSEAIKARRAAKGVVSEADQAAAKASKTYGDVRDD
ncbi:MAG: tripartite tricarboxylate transporter permease [Blautia sp.]|nr:tripartite tricarboxylate transporter permease [Blautia sp.]